MNITRRGFIKGMILTAMSTGILSEIFASKAKVTKMEDDELYYIQTVRGTIRPSQLGLTLTHEHILVDFIGADKVSKDRYNPDEVFEVMLPYLQEIKALGVNGFAECTPMFLGRDPELLLRLSQATDIHILTNTGMYKEPYLPKYAFEMGAEELSQTWIDEANKGIDGTGIKPGFIKIAVNPGNLIPIQQKIVRSAALTSKATGLTIACHTGHGIAGMEAIDIIEKEGVSPDKFIFVHAGAEPDVNYHIKIAQRGAWVEYDNISPNEANRVIQLLNTMLDKGYEDKLLISQDAGWYNVGEPRGGNIRGFAYIVREFIPLMERSGIQGDTISKLLVENPAKALRVRLVSKGVSPMDKDTSTMGKIKTGN